MLPISNHLNWHERPDPVNSAISTAFEPLPKQDRSQWGLFNGSDLYRMCGINEHHLMKALIQKAYPQQKIFRALEIGAGNFEWLEGLFTFIQEQIDLPDDIELHIIGTRGESYKGEKITKVGRCTLYRLGAFKVEELFTQFREQGLFLENQVDLIISNWCFRHLVDPVGTFIQTFNLMKPKTGCFIGDGFFFLQENYSPDNSNTQMIQILIDTKAPFLIEGNNDTRSLNRFILQRPDEGPLQLPMQYLGVHYRGQDDALDLPEFQTKFRRTLENRCMTIEHVNSEELSGDKKLFNFLSANGCFRNRVPKWNCIRRDYCPPEPSALHQAIHCGDTEAVLQCLKNGDDISELDTECFAPLHLAIRLKNHEIFTLLLNHGANIKFSTEQVHTPLHIAAWSDKKGTFLSELIARGADINCYNSRRMTPIYCAIERKNIKAVEILLQHGAKVSERDRAKLLRSKKFLLLREQGLLK